MPNKLAGTPQEIRATAEEIVQTILPAARCELYDHEKRMRCGLLGSNAEKNEFSVLVRIVDRALLESYARTLKANVPSPSGPDASVLS